MDYGPLLLVRFNRMDRNTLVAVLGAVALICLVLYGCFAIMHGIDSTLTVAITAAFTAIITAAATYLRTREGS